MNTVSLAENPSRVPADCPVDVKNVKTLNTSDGYAMTATVFFNGKRIAEVENGGTGGCNFYHPLGYGTPAFDANRAALTEAKAYADKWEGEEVKEYSENLDILIEALMEDKDLAREAKKMRRRGATFVVAGFTHPHKWSEDDDDDDIHYGGQVIAGGRTLEEAIAGAADAGAVAYRVLP